MEILAVFNAKGGVGKTTTAVNLAVCFAAMGRKVMLFDLDAQGNATTSLGQAVLPSIGTFDVVTGAATLKEARLPTFIDDLSLVGATTSLAVVDIEKTKKKRDHHVMRKIAMAHKDTIDIVVLDCPPAFGELTVNALVSAHAVVIPSPPTPYAHDGLIRTWTVLSRIRTTLNHSLRVIGVLPTFLHGEEVNEPAGDVVSACDSSVLSAMNAEYGDLVHPDGIPLNSELFIAAAAKGIPACVLEPNTAASLAYVEVAARILPREKKGKTKHAGFRWFKEDEPADSETMKTAVKKLNEFRKKADGQGLLSTNINIPDVDKDALDMVSQLNAIDEDIDSKIRPFTLGLAFLGVTLLAGVVGFLIAWASYNGLL